MTGTRGNVAAERDRLHAENERLRRAVVAALVRRPGFQLSEGDRQQLGQLGWVNIAGRVVTRDEVLAALQGTDQAGIAIAEPNPDAVDAARALVQRSRERSALYEGRR